MQSEQLFSTKYFMKKALLVFLSTLFLSATIAVQRDRLPVAPSRDLPQPSFRARYKTPYNTPSKKPPVPTLLTLCLQFIETHKSELNQGQIQDLKLRSIFK